MWIVEEIIVTPLTKDNCVPDLTTRYSNCHVANMLSTAHYPMGGVIEIGHYEQDNRRKETGEIDIIYKRAY